MNDFREIRNFPFFGSVKNPISTTGISDPYYNDGFDTMILEVSGPSAISLKVQGCVNQLDSKGEQFQDDSLCPYTDLAIFKASDFTKITTITAPGIYYVGINGCSRVKVNVLSITGNATIVGAMEK